MFIYQVVQFSFAKSHYKVLAKYVHLADAEAHVDALIDKGEGFQYHIQTEFIKEEYK